ncbi:MAG: helix-turn-helix transcriptional regulator [Planctomycetota bacterium]
MDREAAERLKKEIERHFRPGLQTFADLARACGLQAGTFSAWWKGGPMPRARSLQLVARAIGCRIEDLWAAIEPQPAPASDPLVAVTNSLTAELRAGREEDRVRIAELEATVDRLVSESLTGRGTAAAAGRRVLQRKAG